MGGLFKAPSPPPPPPPPDPVALERERAAEAERQKAEASRAARTEARTTAQRRKGRRATVLTEPAASGSSAFPFVSG